ncbi:MAG TPA: FAD-dependent oxidoreductase [Pseudomonas sp.]|nr:FAD-dependent oxidoreductase [Pseudomonas sp.]
MKRTDLDMLDGQVFDVIVIGAGAVGCAAARQLAARNFRTLLVDRGDIGAGTSSRSSRMLYSGLGYLAARYPLWQIPLRPFDMWQRLRYTRQVMQCRAELVKEMPGHLTKHRFHYPFRKQDRYPAWLVDAGFRLVEALGSWKVPLSYRRQPVERAKGQSAMAAAFGGSVQDVGMFEEYMYAWPERICVDTALDAQWRGATIRTYTRVTDLVRTDDAWHVSLQEQAPECTGTAKVRARMVVNAAGPWVDRVPGAGGESSKRVLGIKGVNVMVRLPSAFRGQGLEAFSSKGEPFYVFPWRDHHFIGPTESEYTEDPDLVRVEEKEIDYILNEANLLFPSLQLSRTDVLHTWCGVRPTSTLDGQSTSLPVRLSSTPGKPDLLTLTGSTIMLHRHAARMIAKAVESRLGKRGTAPQGMIKHNMLESNSVRDVILHEHVVRLSDLIRRRLPHGLDESMGRDQAEDLSKAMAEVLGWSESRRLDELSHFEADTRRVYATV